MHGTCVVIWVLPKLRVGQPGRPFAIAQHYYYSPRDQVKFYSSQQIVCGFFAGVRTCGVWRVKGLLRVRLQGGSGVDTERGPCQVRSLKCYRSNVSSDVMVSMMLMCCTCSQSTSTRVLQVYSSTLVLQLYKSAADRCRTLLQGRSTRGLLRRRLQHRAAPDVGHVRGHRLAAGLHQREQQAAGRCVRCDRRSSHRLHDS
jgi:hypothetical protein